MAQVGAVHRAAARHQVVRLVDEQADAPVVLDRQCMQHGAAVEVVVVVAHDHVAPAHHLVAEVIGADAVRQRDRSQGLAVQPLCLGRGLARGRQPVVEAARQRTGRTVAGLVAVFAGLVAGHQLDHPQRQARIAAGTRRAAHLRQRVERHLPARRLGGQEEQLVAGAFGHGAQRRVHGADGLADARGGLHQQRLRRQAGLVHGRRQRALPRAERQLRKRAPHQRGVARAPVRDLLPGPGQEGFAQGFEKPAQRRRIPALALRRFGLLHDVEIHQLQVHRGQAAALAQQPAVDLELGPMQRLLLRRQALERTAVGLDLFQRVAARIESVGPPAHGQRPMAAVQADLGLVVRAAPLRDQLVPLAPLLRGRRRGKAQIEIAGLGGKRAQVAHRYRIQRRCLARSRFDVR